MPDPMIQKLRKETEKDDSLQSLKNVICTGWPRKKDLTVDITPSYGLRETLSIEDGLTMKGERVVIPKSMQRNERKTSCSPYGSRKHAQKSKKDNILARYDG